MSERVLQSGLAVIMLATLFLPFEPVSGGQSVPNWLFFTYVLVETLLALPGGRQASAFFPMRPADWLNLFSRFSVLGVPLLVLFNVFLVVCLRRRSCRLAKALYRLFLLIVTPLTWHLTLASDPVIRGVGFWANTCVVTAAGLIEIAMMACNRFAKSKSADPSAE